MKKPTIDEIIERLQLVLEGKVSREELSNWAEKSSRIFENEGSLSEQDKTIWKGLDVLIGVDLKDSPTEYLHNETDIRNWIARFSALISNK